MDGHHYFRPSAPPLLEPDPSAPRYNDFRTWISALEESKVTIDNLVAEARKIIAKNPKNLPLSVGKVLKANHLVIRNELGNVKKNFEHIEKRIRGER